MQLGRNCKHHAKFTQYSILQFLKLKGILVVHVSSASPKCICRHAFSLQAFPKHYVTYALVRDPFYAATKKNRKKNGESVVYLKMIQKLASMRKFKVKLSVKMFKRKRVSISISKMAKQLKSKCTCKTNASVKV